MIANCWHRRPFSTAKVCIWCDQLFLPKLCISYWHSPSPNLNASVALFIRSTKNKKQLSSPQGISLTVHCLTHLHKFPFWHVHLSGVFLRPLSLLYAFRHSAQMYLSPFSISTTKNTSLWCFSISSASLSNFTTLCWISASYISENCWSSHSFYCPDCWRRGCGRFRVGSSADVSISRRVAATMGAFRQSLMNDWCDLKKFKQIKFDLKQKHEGQSGPRVAHLYIL